MDARLVGQKIKQAYPNSRYSTLDDELLGQAFLKKFASEGSGVASPLNYLGGTGSYLPSQSTTDYSSDVFFDPEDAFNKFKKTPEQPKSATPVQGGLTTNTNTQSATLAPAKPNQPDPIAGLPTQLPSNINPGGSMQDVLKKKMFTL